MRYFTILIFTTLWVLNSYAQEFGTHWQQKQCRNFHLLRFLYNK